MFSPANSRVPILFFWEIGQYAHPYTMGPAQGDTERSFLRSFLATSCIAVLDRIHPKRVKTEILRLEGVRRGKEG